MQILWIIDRLGGVHSLDALWILCARPQFLLHRGKGQRPNEIGQRRGHGDHAALLLTGGASPANQVCRNICGSIN
ncbi:MAG: hypothetical protein IT483_15740 [Gammaproteobacteria bacterium]|nr:hypothetical protein [Gammaproteobacteria bacterium]